ncbi:hypothetical protein, partial [Maricaulis sp.]|uniref:hypothetical protein n=1 Tax=Maricaulis sp. TaxID=1486257 RepID=UPI0025BEA059
MKRVIKVQICPSLGRVQRLAMVMALGLALIAPTPVMAQSNADGLRQALSQYQAEIGDGGTPSPSTLAGLRANRELLE